VHQLLERKMDFKFFLLSVNLLANISLTKKCLIQFPSHIEEFAKESLDKFCQNSSPFEQNVPLG